ncbi:MAG: hypothetical protein A4S16_03465 [Proteobacteria bacterium SG_bin6]|nr:MAG: hypothetical protein A4S16_03465 [Proteobacteria bacterium SG_bin6]
MTKPAHRPPRPRPPDFRATFISLGWSGVGQHYGASDRVIRRWIDEEGRAELVAARAAHVRALQRQMHQLREQLAQPFLARQVSARTKDCVYG